MSAPFVARNSIPIAILFFLVGVGLAALAWWGPQSFGLNPKPHWETFRWPTLVLGLVLMVSFGRDFFDRRVQIRVGPDGVFLRNWSDDLIPWSAISAFRIEKQYTSWPLYLRHLYLDLHDPTKYPSTTWRGRFLGRGSNRGYGDITVATIGTETNVDKLLETMEHFSGRARSG